MVRFGYLIVHSIEPAIEVVGPSHLGRRDPDHVVPRVETPGLAAAAEVVVRAGDALVPEGLG